MSKVKYLRWSTGFENSYYLIIPVDTEGKPTYGSLVYAESDFEHEQSFVKDAPIIHRDAILKEFIEKNPEFIDARILTYTVRKDKDLTIHTWRLCRHEYYQLVQTS